MPTTNDKSNQSATNGKATRPRESCFALKRDEWGQLQLIDSEGVRHFNVAMIPVFPISDPKRWISICEADGHEIVCIEEPLELAPEVRQMLNEEVACREFVPVIERIVWVSGNSEPCEWRVETDRGKTSFVLKSEEDVRRLGDHQIIIHDANGIRYLIPDLRQADAKTRRIIEWYV